MSEKQFIITLAADKLTPELEALLNAQGAEIRTEEVPKLEVSEELGERLTRDLIAIEEGRSEGKSWTEVKADLDAYLAEKRKSRA